MSTRNRTPDNYPTRRHLRRACDRLTPVVLDLGPGQPRMESFLTELCGTGRSAHVVLAPIAAALIPPGCRVTVRSRDPEEPLCIEHGRVEATGSGTAVLHLDRATLARMARRRCPRRAVTQAPLTLVVPMGTEDGDVHVFPVVDLSSGYCSIEATHPLEPGRAFDPVEVVGDRRTLRRARAIVEEVLPWIDSRGERRFRCRAKLEPCTASERPTRDLVDDPRRIRTVLELAAMAGTRVSLGMQDGGTIHATLESAESAALGLALPQPLGRVGSPTHAVAGFELFGVAYEMRVRVLSVRGAHLETAFPLSLRRMRIRSERRVSCPPGEARVSFVNPATGARCTRELVDISFGGLCFRTEDEDVVWNDMPLESCRLEWRGRECDLGEMRVKVAGEDTVHAGMVLAPPSENHLLIDLLATLGHPELGVDQGEDFRGILDAYRRSGIFHGYMVRNLEPIAPAAARAWRIIRSDGPELTRTLVHEQDGETDATISVLRSWDNGWIVQHFGASSADGFRWSGELQMASLDYLIPRPSGRYVFFFVETKNRSMNAFYERFFKLTGTSEAIERSTVQLWSLPAAKESLVPEREQGWNLRPLRQRDEALVARAASRALGPMTSAALSLVPGEMKLPALSEAYRRIGLDRGRELEILSHDRRPSFAMFHERCSPGLNLTGKLNATWLLPIHARPEEHGPGLRACIARAMDIPPAARGLDRFMILPDGMDVTALEAASWEHRMTVNTYVLNRAGLVRYYDYIADRYGSADLRTARRAAAASARMQGVAS